MRLKTLLIERYGCFERALIPFDPAPGRLNLIVAPNGAGKSVLRAAFHDLLFGIPKQSPMKFRFGYPDMHLHADAVSDDGTDFAFAWRRRGERSYPAEATGAGEAGRRLAAAMGRITPRQVEQLFALDTARLREGGDELARGGDELGVALLSGSGELASARAIRIALEERRALLWKNARSGTLPAALRDLDGVRRRMREAVQPVRQREAQERAIAQQQALREAADADFAAARATERRLTRIARVRPHLHDLDRARAWLAENAHAPVLPETLGERLAGAVAAASLAEATLHAKRETAERAEANTDGIAEDSAALDHERRLGRLAEALGKSEKATADIATVQQEREAALADMRRSLRDIGSDAPPEQAASLLPDLALVARARDLIGEHAAIVAKRQDADKRAREAAERLDAMAGEAEIQDAPADLDRLKALLAEIAADGDPRRRAEAAEDAMRDAQTTQASCLARIPGWSGGSNALIAIPVPDETRLARLETECARAASVLQAAEAEHARQLADHGSCLRDLAKLREAKIPHTGMLVAARQERDRLWGRVYREAFGGEPAAEAEEQPLPLLYERSLRAADDVADRITADVARVEEAARLTRLSGEGERACAMLADKIKDARLALEAARRDWAGACTLVRLPPDSTMREMRSFILARQDMVGAIEAVTRAQGSRQALAVLHAGWAQRLAAALGQHDSGLPALLTEAGLAVRRGDSAALAAADRGASERAATQERERAIQAEQRAEKLLADWHARWDATLVALRRPAGEMPAVTQTMLQHLDALRLHYDTAARLALRLRGMRADVADFAAEASSLAAALGEQGDDSFALARTLIARREHAVKQESRRDQASQERDAARLALANAEEAAGAALRGVQALLAACGARDLADAEARLIAAHERRQNEALRDTAEAALLRDGEQIAEPELRAEAEAVSPQAMQEAREAAEVAVGESKARSEQALQALTSLEQSLVQERQSTDATTAAMEQEAAAALVSRLLDEEIVLRVASDMLGNAMQAVEQGAGDAAIGRISRAFERITAGACAVRAGEDEQGRTVLTVIDRGEEAHPKAIPGLSEGTRDQLYLALRMVAIEDHVAAGPRLPFIADDVLQTFDDARALATFRALVAMSEAVQVIVLTHHEHLVELAAGLPVHVHRLAA